MSVPPHDLVSTSASFSPTVDSCALVETPGLQTRRASAGLIATTRVADSCALVETPGLQTRRASAGLIATTRVVESTSPSDEDIPGYTCELPEQYASFLKHVNRPLVIDSIDPLSVIIFQETSPTQVDVFFPLPPYPHSRIPFLCPKEKHPNGMPEYLSMKESREIQWYYHYQPYLAFVPKDDVFQGPIFGRLRGSRQTFEENVVAHTYLQFIFHPLIANSWLRLESALLFLITGFYVRLSPMTAPRPPLPSDTRFFDPKPTVKNVLDSVIFAQKCFLYLIAELRYSIAKCQEVYCKEGLLAYTKLPRIRKLDFIWMRDLAASTAMTSKNLAGCVVHPRDLPSGFDVHQFADHGAPVYIPIASISRKLYEENDIVHYIPDQFNITPLIDQHTLHRFLLPFYLDDVIARVTYEWHKHHKDNFLDIPFVQNSEPVFAHETPVELPTSLREPEGQQPSPYPEYDLNLNFEDESPQSPNFNLPDPLPGSNQNYGEWWYYQYRYLVSLVDDAEYASSSTRILSFQTSNAIPTICHDDFFAWERTPSHPDFLLRRCLELSEARRAWPTYPSTHRLYNPLKNEWDLFHISCDFETLSLDATICEEPTALDIGLFNLTEATAKNTVVTDLCNDRNAVFSTQLENVRNQRPLLFCEKNPLEYAKRRFGFLFPDPLIVHNASSITKLPWWFYLGQLGCQLVPPVETQLRETLWLLEKGQHHQLLPLLDILSLADVLIARNTVHITYFPSVVFEYSERQVRNLYILEFPDEVVSDWILGVSQAADIVLALREGWATDRQTLIEQFLSHGIRFGTFSPVPEKIPILGSEFQKYDLPAAPVHHEYTMTDFHEYEKQREEFFDSPFGRIAGRSGGIVARLWRRDTSKFKHRVDEVSFGPTVAALFKGVRVKLGGRYFFDDELTERMDAYICGQYKPEKIRTRGIGNASKKIHYNLINLSAPFLDDWFKRSWYPTNHASNNILRWTDHNETSFNDVEKEILAKFTTKHANFWKNFSSKKQGKLDDWYEPVCKRFLSRYIAQKAEESPPFHSAF